MSIFRRTKDKKEKKDAWAEEYRAMNGVEEEFEADKKKADEELEAEAKAALKEQEKAEKKQQAQVQAQIQAQNDTVVAIKAFVEMGNKFLSELGKKTGVELPGINPVEAKDEIKADAEVKDEPKADTEAKDEPKADTEAKDEPKADTEAKDEPKADAEAKDEPKADTEAEDEAVNTDVAKAKADADAAAKSETKPNAKIKAKSKAKKGLVIGEDYLVRDLKTGKFVSKKTWEEAQATPAADAYRIKVWKNQDGSIERPLDVQEILEHFSRSKYSGKRKAFVFFDEGGILRVIPYEEIYAALQAVNFTESFLTKRLVEYDEKGEFVRFADIPAPPVTATT